MDLEEQEVVRIQPTPPPLPPPLYPPPFPFTPRKKRRPSSILSQSRNLPSHEFYRVYRAFQHFRLYRAVVTTSQPRYTAHLDLSIELPFPTYEFIEKTPAVGAMGRGAGVAAGDAATTLCDAIDDEVKMVEVRHLISTLPPLSNFVPLEEFRASQERKRLLGPNGGEELGGTVN